MCAERILDFLQQKEDDSNLYLYVMTGYTYRTIYPLVTDIDLQTLETRYPDPFSSRRKPKQFKSFEELFGTSPTTIYVGIEKPCGPRPVSGWISEDKLHYIVWY